MNLQLGLQKYQLPFKNVFQKKKKKNIEKEPPKKKKKGCNGSCSPTFLLCPTPITQTQNLKLYSMLK